MRIKVKLKHILLRFIEYSSVQKGLKPCLSEGLIELIDCTKW